MTFALDKWYLALGKLAYGLLFVAVLPAALVAWARATDDVVRVVLPDWSEVGWAFTGLGAALVIASSVALARWGGGLPMNAFPPPRLVARGPYRLVRHPIYVGFTLGCLGLSLAYRSASGLLLVTPAVALGSAALVLGYEGLDLRRRFGTQPATWTTPAPAADARPTLAQRTGAWALVVVPWCVLYQLVTFVGAPADAISAYLPFERGLPVLEEAELFYASTYLVVLGAPLLARRQRDLRAFELRALAAMVLVFPLYFALPLMAEPRAFEPRGALGALLGWERTVDSPAGAFPSFHVVWAIVAADLVAADRPRLRWACKAWVWAVAVSCLATGMHALVDVVAGFATVALVDRRARVWEALRRWAERLGNSWREWRFGRVRVINHGIYPGLGTFVGLALVGTIVGPGQEILLLFVGVGGVVGAGAWGQLLEGSAVLMRPYGFWGGLFGIILASFLAPLAGGDPWLLLGATCVAAPWVQSLGRLRCLVQGCCHGAPTDPAVGIRHWHPRSRVVRLAALANVPVHPTAMYSILWNVVIALCMTRLWTLGVDARFAAGSYLVLMGFGRFVEEALRGEPQTAVLAGLRVYQWLSIGALVTGAALTAFHGATPLTAYPPTALGMALAAACGLFAAVAMGVDFPDSRRPLSRLA